jgi:hypothetical protein
MSRIISVLAALLVGSCATQPQVRVEDRRLIFGCSDIVVIAGVRNEREEPARTRNDLLGHSWFTATLNVKHVVRGTGVPTVLPVRYHAHASFRQDLDLMLVLKRSGSGYEITTGQLMWFRPFLASRCTG